MSFDLPGIDIDAIFPDDARAIRRIAKRALPSGAEDDCIYFDGAHSGNGYPHFKYWYSTVTVARFVCAVRYGLEFDEKWQARHICGNARCINPLHIEPGTEAENAADREAHGRTLRGEAHGSAKLTEAEAIEILNDPRPYWEIAYEYDVAASTIGDLKRGASWGHLPRPSKPETTPATPMQDAKAVQHGEQKHTPQGAAARGSRDAVTSPDDLSPIGGDINVG